MRSETMAQDNRDPGRSIRVPDDVWDAALATARERGESLSEVCRVALIRYTKRHQPTQLPPPIKKAAARKKAAATKTAAAKKATPKRGAK